MNSIDEVVAHSQNHEIASGLPSGLGRPALRALAAAGYSRLEQLTSVKERDLRKLHGMGPKAIALIREALAARGQSFADAEPE